MECRLCNSDKLKLLFLQGDQLQYKFYRCMECGLVNLDIKDINISNNQQKYYGRFKPFNNYEDDKRVRDAYRFIRKYVPLTNGKFLDIGCGGGSLLYFAAKDGWEVKGIEIADGYVDYVKEKLGVEVIHADFLKLKNFNEKFDLVSLRHVLEHLPDSVLAMNKISSLLNDGGYAHFEFPNINSITHRFNRFLLRNKIISKTYGPDYNPAHCNEFSRQSFSYLLGLTGFQLIRWETYSFKPFTNFLYNRIWIGTKARAIIRKT